MEAGPGHVHYMTHGPLPSICTELLVSLLVSLVLCYHASQKISIQGLGTESSY